jgi:hypothetical protein
MAIVRAVSARSRSRHARRRPRPPRETIERRAPDQHRVGTERHRLDDVAAPAHAAVEKIVILPPTRATIAGSASSVAIDESSARPPWFETTTPSAPSASARSASSG